MVTSDGLPLETIIDLKFSIVPVLLALTGIFIAYRLYFKPSEQPQKIAAKLVVFTKQLTANSISTKSTLS
jgi:NADH-quinone oxidoreductase subunit L